MLRWYLARPLREKLVITLLSFALAPQLILSWLVLAYIRPLVAGQVVTALAQRVWIAAALAAILALCSALVWAWYIAAPIVRLRHFAEQVANGNLAQPPLPQVAMDEIGQATQAVNQMLVALKGTVGELTGTAQTLDQARRQVTALADGLAQETELLVSATEVVSTRAEATRTQVLDGNRMVAELRSAAEQVAAGAQTQAEQLTQAASASQRLAAGVQVAAQSAPEVAAAANAAWDVARKGGTAVRQVADGMARIAASTEDGAHQVEELGQDMGRIDRILQVISEIADQTNLLSLNAAIEAARAGEHGKGFAVVADEVRRLAGNSARSSQEIAEQVSSLMAESRRLADAIRGSNAQVAAGTGLTHEAAAALTQIEQEVAGTREKVRQIGQAVQAVHEESDHVAGAVTTLVSIAEQNAAVSEELAATGEEMHQLMGRIAAQAAEDSTAVRQFADGANQVAAAAEELSAHAVQLNQLVEAMTAAVSRFRL